MRVLFRIHDGPGVGIGHFARCHALGDELHERGHDVSYLSTTSLGALATLDRRDALETVRRADAFRARWIVVDGWVFDSLYLSVLGDPCRNGKLLSVVDNCVRSIYADLTLDQNFMALSQEGRPATLFGPKYALLRDEFREARAAQGHRNGHILVMTGGGPRSEIHDVMVAAAKLTGKSVVSTCPTDDPAVASVSAGFGKIASEMRAARLVFTTAGVTCLECACIGVPFVPLARNMYEKTMICGLQNFGVYSGETLERLDPIEKMAGVLADSLGDMNRMKRQVDNGMRHVDGQGCVRVVNAMEAL